MKPNYDIILIWSLNAHKCVTLIVTDMSTHHFWKIQSDPWFFEVHIAGSLMILWEFTNIEEHMDSVTQSNRKYIKTPYSMNKYIYYNNGNLYYNHIYNLRVLKKFIDINIYLLLIDEIFWQKKVSKNEWRLREGELKAELKSLSASILFFFILLCFDWEPH